MGYRNKSRDNVVISAKSMRKGKRLVKRLARQALKRDLRGEHPRNAMRETRRGHWYD